MAPEPLTKLEKSIKPYHVEQLRNGLSTIVGGELQDRRDNAQEDDDTDVVSETEPVNVSLHELVRATPVPQEKAELVMEQFASEPGSGIDYADDTAELAYQIDPTL